jgi:hypothetical protein
MKTARVLYKAIGTDGKPLGVPWKDSLSQARKLGSRVMGISEGSIQIRVEFAKAPGDKYVLCGTDRDGKRFRLENDSFEYLDAINAYKGNLYLQDAEGKKYLLKEIYN